MSEEQIEFIARGVIMYRRAILLCKPRVADYFYFPGGHVEFDEDMARALRREIKEETDADVMEMRFIGIVENEFFQHSFHETPRRKHEVNVVFEAKLVSLDIKNTEDHIECLWVPLQEFKEARVLPVFLKEKVSQWMQDKQVFFGSEKEGERYFGDL